jgi:hypothetical protein
MKPLSEYEVIDYQDETVKHVHYEDENGCHFDDIGEFLQSKILGHCGCGMPEDNLKLVHDMLTIYQDFWDKGQDLKMLSDESKENWDKKQQDLKNYVHENWEKFVYFFWYVMTDKDIMEHGGSVPGWICDDNFLDAIKLWHKDYETKCQ